MEGDLKKIGALGIGLLAFMILAGVFFLVGNLWTQNLCTQDDADHVWTNGECQVSATNTTESDIDAITYVQVVVSVFVMALGFLSIIVLVGIAKILLKLVKGF